MALHILTQKYSVVPLIASHSFIPLGVFSYGILIYLIEGMGLCAERRGTTELHKANLSSATLVLPLDVGHLMIIYYLCKVWAYGLSAEGPLNCTRLI